MLNALYDIHADDNNPLDFVEEMAKEKKWKITRVDETFLLLNLETSKTSLEICLEWQDEFSSLLFACTIPLEIGEAQMGDACDVVEQINASLWLGHFDFSNKGKHPTFRHTFLFRMIPAGLAVEHINDVVDLATSECNRFYQTFQMIQAGDAQAQDNLTAVVFETMGEA